MLCRTGYHDEYVMSLSNAWKIAMKGREHIPKTDGGRVGWDSVPRPTNNIGRFG
jgi:hypothetical protein